MMVESLRLEVDRLLQLLQTYHLTLQQLRLQPPLACTSLIQHRKQEKGTSANPNFTVLLSGLCS